MYKKTNAFLSILVHVCDLDRNSLIDSDSNQEDGINPCIPSTQRIRGYN